MSKCQENASMWVNSAAESPEPNFLTSGNADQWRGSQILSERAAGDSDGGAIWLCGCHREVVISTVNYIWCNHRGPISDGMWAAINILQIWFLSGYSCLSCQVEICSKSEKLWCSIQTAPCLTFLCKFILFSPSRLTPHPFTSASSSLSSSTEYTNYYKDTSSLGMMK